jgi:hypothetical protein
LAALEEMILFLGLPCHLDTHQGRLCFLSQEASKQVHWWAPLQTHVRPGEDRLHPRSLPASSASTGKRRGLQEACTSIRPLSGIDLSSSKTVRRLAPKQDRRMEGRPARAWQVLTPPLGNEDCGVLLGSVGLQALAQHHCAQKQGSTQLCAHRSCWLMQEVSWPRRPRTRTTGTDFALIPNEPSYCPISSWPRSLLATDVTYLIGALTRKAEDHIQTGYLIALL